MQKAFTHFIEAVYWMGIFLSPVLLFGVIAVTLFAYNKVLLSILAALTGIILGIIWAERIRRKYGCSNYIGNILATPDIWPIPKEKYKSEEENKSKEN